MGEDDVQLRLFKVKLKKRKQKRSYCRKKTIKNLKPSPRPHRHHYRARQGEALGFELFFFAVYEIWKISKRPTISCVSTVNLWWNKNNQMYVGYSSPQTWWFFRVSFCKTCLQIHDKKQQTSNKKGGKRLRTAGWKFEMCDVKQCAQTRTGAAPPLKGTIHIHDTPKCVVLQYPCRHEALCCVDLSHL